jgi:hypothetical protein
MKAILRGDGWWTYSSNDNHFSLKLILVSSESMLAWTTIGCSSWGILWPMFMLSQHLFCTDNVMSNVDGIVLVQCLWVYWPTACLILFIEKCLYQNMEPRYLIQILLGSSVGLRCLFQWFLWFSGSSSSECILNVTLFIWDACTLVKANLFGDLTFSVGYSLSMWIAIQLQLDSNSVQWWEVFFSLNTGFFCSCSMLINYTLLGSSYQNMSYWVKKSDILHPSTRVSHSDPRLLNLVIGLKILGLSLGSANPRV